MIFRPHFYLHCFALTVFSCYGRTEVCFWIKRLEVICKSKINVAFPVLNEALDFEKFVTSQPRFEANAIRAILPLREAFSERLI